MEVPEQKLPLVFSQMLQMFPNIPQDIIWIYVQRYSNDIEKCAQMLNLQSVNYSNAQSSPDLHGNKNLRGYNNDLPLLLFPKAMPDFNNELKPLEQLSSQNDTDNDSNEKNKNDSQSVVFHNQQSILNVQNTDVSHNILHQGVPDNSTAEFSKIPNTAVNFQEPLTLDISIDEDEGSVHSWRPNLSVGTLCSDLFLPSSVLEDFHLSNSQISNLNAGHFMHERETNPESAKLNHWTYSENSMGLLHGYPTQSVQNYGVDISGHLHLQKSQMNSIRYEVIKAKIELSDVNESIEKLVTELEEKLKSRHVQDIEKLKEEVIQLRLECQCLCTEVDYCSKDIVLLGEVDESSYNGKTVASTESRNPVNNSCRHLEDGNSDCQDESNMWNCPECTFDNHPAINACEMCHLPRPYSRKPPFMPTPSDTCYCHPKKESLSVRS